MNGLYCGDRSTVSHERFISADALIERGRPRNLRLPQFRSGHRLHGQNSKVGVMSGLATTQELNEDLYLRRSYLTLFLNGTGYQESKLES